MGRNQARNHQPDIILGTGRGPHHFFWLDCRQTARGRIVALCSLVQALPIATGEPGATAVREQASRGAGAWGWKQQARALGCMQPMPGACAAALAITHLKEVKEGLGPHLVCSGQRQQGAAGGMELLRGGALDELEARQSQCSGGAASWAWQAGSAEQQLSRAKIEPNQHPLSREHGG